MTIKNMPMNSSTGSTYDISPLLCFHFWKPVYSNSDDSNFPSTSKEESGRFAGISENTGHDMTLSMLNLNNNKVINRSKVRQVQEPSSPKIRAEPLTKTEVVKYHHVETDDAEFPSTHLEYDNKPS